MDQKGRKAIERAIQNQQMVTVQYAKPGAKGKGAGPVVTRHVRPYELSVNRSGRPVVWGSDSIHGPRQLHAFRTDRIVAVKESKQPTEFEPARTVAKHLLSYQNVGGPVRHIQTEVSITVEAPKKRKSK